MTVSFALLPLAAATTRYVAHQVSDTLKAGMSFASALSAADGTPPTGEPQTSGASAVGVPSLTTESQLVRWRAAWQNIQLQTQSLRKALVEQFAVHGIDLSEPIVLTTDVSGRVLAGDERMDRSQVELVLEANPELTAQVHELFQQVASLQATSGTDGSQQLEDLRLVVDQRQAFFAGSPDMAAWN